MNQLNCKLFILFNVLFNLYFRKKYNHAFLSCRTHRIDTNILYDYNPSQFLNNVHLFINQIDSSEYLNLFLSTLKYYYNFYVIF